MRRITLYMNNGSCNTMDFITHDVLLKAADSEPLKLGLEQMDITVCTSGDILQAGSIMSRSREREIESNLLLKGMLRKFAKERRGLFLIAENTDGLTRFEQSLYKFNEGLNIVGRCAVSEVVGSDDAIVNEVNNSLPDVVFINLPSPRAESFIQENRMKFHTQLVAALRDVCLKVTEDGRVKQGGIGNLILRRFFHSAAKKFTKEENKATGETGNVLNITGDAGTEEESPKIVQIGPRDS